MFRIVSDVTLTFIKELNPLMITFSTRTAWLTASENRVGGEAAGKQENDVWANFDSFSDQSSSVPVKPDAPAAGQEQLPTEDRKSNEIVTDSTDSSKSHSAAKGSDSCATDVECDAEKS
jgi:hypothetical protein